MRSNIFQHSQAYRVNKVIVEQQTPNKNTQHKQDYDFDVKTLFERANNATKANFAVMLKSLFITFAVFLTFFIVYINFMEIETVGDVENIPTDTSYLANMILTILMAPLTAGMVMMGVNTERKKPTNVLQLFDYIPRILLLAAAALMISILWQIGLSLFVLPGLYIFLTTTFAQTLIADKGTSPFQALKISILISNRFLAKLFVVYAIFLALFLLAMITFGIALVWVLPLYYNLTGILYNDLFGDVQVSEQAVTKNTSGETHFDA
ncbi:MAG: hypothetical protein ACI97K_002883 [Glaciecola sp.]